MKFLSVRVWNCNAEAVSLYAYIGLPFIVTHITGKGCQSIGTAGLIDHTGDANGRRGQPKPIGLPPPIGFSLFRRISHPAYNSSAMKLRHLWAFMQLTRPLFLGGGVVLYLFGAALALTQGATLDWPRLILGQLLVTSIQLTTHYANEYYDYDVDRLIGDRRTPFSGGSGVLVSGQLDRVVALHATRVCLGIAVVMLIVSGLAVPVMWLIGSIALLGGYFYSAPPLSLEGSGFGELDTVLLTALLVPLTGYTMQAGHVDASVLNFAAPLILIDLAMILTFEFADYPADQMHGKTKHHRADRTETRGMAASSSC